MKRLIKWLEPWLVFAILHGLWLTLRVARYNWQVVESLERKRQPYLMAVWHNNLMLVVPVFGWRRGYRPQPMAVMISRSKDGERIGRVYGLSGFSVVRGSTSAGAGAALKELVRRVKGGAPLGITPDGPRGPRYVLQPGVAAIARMAHAPVVPFAWAARSRWRASSWDAMMLPKPFARVALLAGDPIWPQGKEETVEALAGRIEAAMLQNCATVERLMETGLLKLEPRLKGAKP